jgi:hypothetical protein
MRHAGAAPLALVAVPLVDVPLVEVPLVEVPLTVVTEVEDDVT